MGPERILVVDDEPRVAGALCRVLSLPQGGENVVESCSSGEAALARLHDCHFDLLITDLRLPGLSGLDLLERMRPVSPTTRSMLITAFGSAEVEERAHRLANVYLPKPFSLRDFIQAVHTALGATPMAAHALTIFTEAGLQAIRQRLDGLRASTGAKCIMLTDRSGQLLAECGQRGDFDADVMLALLGNGMAAVAEVAHLLHEDSRFDLHFHEGRRFEVYVTMVSDVVYLTLLFERQLGGSRLGLIALYVGRAVDDLRGLLTAAVQPGAAPGPQANWAAEVTRALDEAFNPPGGGGERPNEQPADRRSGPGLLSFEQAQAHSLVKTRTAADPRGAGALARVKRSGD